MATFFIQFMICSYVFYEFLFTRVYGSHPHSGPTRREDLEDSLDLNKIKSHHLHCCLRSDIVHRDEGRKNVEQNRTEQCQMGKSLAVAAVREVNSPARRWLIPEVAEQRLKPLVRKHRRQRTGRQLPEKQMEKNGGKVRIEWHRTLEWRLTSFLNLGDHIWLGDDGSMTWNVSTQRQDKLAGGTLPVASHQWLLERYNIYTSTEE